MVGHRIDDTRCGTALHEAPRENGERRRPVDVVKYPIERRQNGSSPTAPKGVRTEARCGNFLEASARAEAFKSGCTRKQKMDLQHK
jgi:hypothetical protein